MPESAPRFRFDFHEVVRVVSDDPELAPIRGEAGVVLGRGDDPADPGAYGVLIYRDQRVWCLPEDGLETTGTFEPPEPPTHAFRVRVDEAGRGHFAGIRKLERGA